MAQDSGLRVEVSASGSARLLALDMDGLDRLVAEWTVPLRASERGDAVVTRSPSGERAAVRVGEFAWTFGLQTGELVGQHTANPGYWQPDVLYWGTDEIARIWMAADGPLDALLAAGVQINILGPVEEDDGEATSGGGGGSLYFVDPETSRAAKEAAFKKARATANAAALAEVHLRLAVSFHGRESIVQDVHATHRAGLMRVQWPPLTGPHGVLIRRVHVQSLPPQGGLRQTHSEAFEVQHPWLITPDGQVHTLPFVLGNRPLTTMPDGRFLLPCFGPMWWDGPNEGLSVVDNDGNSELLKSDDGHLTPIGIVRAIDPSLVPAEDPDDHDTDEAWTCVAACADADTLTVALEHGDRGVDPGGSWLVAELPLDGTTCGPPRRIAGGTPPTDTVARVIL